MIEETELHAAIAQAVLAALDDSKPDVRGRALSFLEHAPAADPDGWVVDRAESGRGGFAGIRFEATGRSLEDALIQAVASRALVLRDPRAIGVLHREALEGTSSPTWYALAVIDPPFVAANAETLARRGSLGWLRATAAAGTLDVPAMTRYLTERGAVSRADAHAIGVEIVDVPQSAPPTPVASDTALDEFVASLGDTSTREALDSFNLNALPRIQPADRPLVRTLLEARLLDADPRAAHALAVLGDPAVAPSLQRAIAQGRETGGARMVLACAQALQKLTGRDPTPDLVAVLAQRASFDVTIGAGTLLAEAAPLTARPLLRERLVPPHPAPVREGLLRPWLSTFWKTPVVDPTSRLAAVMKLLASPLDDVATLAEAELDALEADITPSRLGYAGWTLPVDTTDDAAPDDPRKRAVIRAAVWSRLLRAPTVSDVALARMLDPEAPAVLEAAATSKILAFGPHEVAILRTLP